MLKFLLITIIVIYILFKIGGYLFRVLYMAMGGETERQEFNKQNGTRKKGDLNIDYVPKKKGKAAKDFKGGEYIDYEEVD